MLPSQQRRHERQGWIGFVVLCLGSLALVLILSWVAGHVIEPRAVEQVQEEPPAPPEPVVYPERVAGLMGDAIATTARTIKGTLASERQLDIDGGVLFLKGAFVLAHHSVSTPEGQRLLMLTLQHGDFAPDDPEHKVTADILSVDVYQRVEDTWQSVAKGAYSQSLDPHTDSSVYKGDDVVAWRDAGAGVWAIEIPDPHRCLPIVRSDEATHRTLYISPGGTPEVLFQHVSAGKRGNLPEQKARVELHWSSRTAGTATGTVVLTEWSGDDELRHEVGFQQVDNSMLLDVTPSTVAIPAERDAAASAREGRPDALERYQALIHHVELLMPLGGSLPYCIGMPHRVQPSPTVDRSAWDDALTERVFRMHMQLAEVIAREGHGRDAIKLLALRDPAIVLTSTPAGRRILDALRGPRVNGIELHAVTLDRRKMYARDPRLQTTLPMLWLEGARLLVPEPAPRMEPSAIGVAMVHGGLEGVNRWVAESTPNPFAVAAPPLWVGAVHGVARLLASEQPRYVVPLLVGHTHRRVLEQIARVAERDNLYTGHRFRRLALARDSWSQASWEEMQSYATLSKPHDLSPSGSRLVVDAGVTCEGSFLQLCVGFPERCRDGVSPPHLSDTEPSAGELSSTLKVELPGISAAPCYPSESPEKEGAPFAIVGWLDDARVLLRRELEVYTVEIPIGGAPSASIFEPSIAPEDIALASQAWPGRGPGQHFAVELDEVGLWLVDTRDGRDYLLEWWSRLPFGPADGAWQATLSPDGHFLAVWVEGDGLWTARVARLP